MTNNLFVRADKREGWAVRDDVEFKINTDFILEGYDIDVKVKDGVVTLSGSTQSWYDKSHAKDVAARVRGVEKVINNIRVDWERKYTDPQLTNTIKDRLGWNWTTKGVSKKIHVTIHNGVANLTGDVNSWSERTEAGHVAMRTDGIWAVDNRLTVHGYDYL